MPPLTRQQLGKLGERLAADYVRGLGWRVEATRFRVRDGEIDLVCVDGTRSGTGAGKEATLVFVEVRARTGTEFGDGVESVDARKVLRMSRVAQAYLHQYNWGGSVRLDVVALRLSPSGELESLDHRRDISL